MIKNKEWLSDRWDDLTSNVAGRNRYYDGYDRALMDIEPFIDQLDEPEITEEQAWNKIAESYPADVRSLATSFQNFYYGDFIKNSTLSKKESVEVPQFVADFIESNKRRGNGLWSAISRINKISDSPLSSNELEIIEWVYGSNVKNVKVDKMYARQEIIARAWLDGYTIEKEPEKLYQVILPTPNNMAEMMFLVEGRRVITNWFCSSRIENYKHQFTEQEIKAIDERYWAFAEEVTET